MAPSFLPRLEQTSTIGLVRSTCFFSFRLPPLLLRLESGTSRERMTEQVCRSLWRPNIIIFFKAHQHKACRRENWAIERLQRCFTRWSSCFGRRPHSPAGGPWTAAEIEMLFLCCPRWHQWCVCQFLEPDRQPWHSMYLMSRWRLDRKCEWTADTVLVRLLLGSLVGCSAWCGRSVGQVLLLLWLVLLLLLLLL